ncbi:MAG: hypothetical protein RQ826_08205 [Xanthomonadales bacterium]|nr:hypothetical protein [Xanthomonadales bacterium]
MQGVDQGRLEIRATADRASQEAFIRVPWSLYADDPHWVPPLLIERRAALSPKNPFFRHAQWQGWTAWRGGQAVGRISAQIDRFYLQRHDPHTGFFGMIEAPDDSAVFAALFGAAEAWLRQRGMRRALGPFNLGINQEVGLLVEGFDSAPYVMMGHGRPWYGPSVEALGYRREQDLLAYALEVARFSMPEAVRRLLQRQSQGVELRSFQRAQRKRDLGIMRDIFNDAWSNNWGFVPFSEEEFEAVGKELLMLVPEDFIRIAEVHGEPAAFIVLLPNINEAIADLNGRLLPFGWARLLWRLKRRFPGSARVPLMGVRQRYQNTRLGPALAFLLIDGLKAPADRRGVKRVELSWILEDNQGMRNILEKIGATTNKRYRIYARDLE